jgi:copper resistance protein B
MTCTHRKPSQQTKLRSPVKIVIFILAAIELSAVWAQDAPPQDPHAGHDMPPPAAAPEGEKGDADTPAESAGEQGTTGMEMDMGAMQGGPAPPDARNPHAYSEGLDFGPSKLELADTRNMAALLADNLEAIRTGGNTSVPFDLQAWYGRTYNRAVLKAEGDIDSRDVAEARTELLWGHAFATFWDRQVGVRYDSGEGPNRSWLAFGVQGLAPYRFEVDATAYLGDSGRSALRFDGSYELLLTQKLILQPRIEANIYGRRDAERLLGSGLSDVAAGLRLRYEIRREIAPYVGIEWVRRYGETEDLVRAAGEDPNDARIVAGLRFWF